MNEHLKNRLVTLIEKDTPLTPENLQEVFSDGIDKIGTSRDKIDGLIDQVRNSIIQNSVQLLVQRLLLTYLLLVVFFY
jgi:hypothetical protein